MRWSWASTLACLVTTAVSTAAWAQEDEGFDKDNKDALDNKDQLDKEKTSGEKMPGEKEPPKAPGPDPELDPREEDGKRYTFAGLRFRNIIVPKFMLNLFADGGTSVNVFTFGPELTTRKDHLEFNIALSYADYSMDPFLFKGKDDGIEAFERVSSDMKLIYITFDLLYEIPIDKEGRFAFLFGGGIGLAPVFGNLYRNQIYPENAQGPDQEDHTKWNECIAPGNPGGANARVGGTDTGKPYCDDENEHFGEYDEPSWANGGSKPFIFPWISLPQLSFRFKPIKQINTRFDAGFSITGFFFGMNAGYLLPI